MAKENNISAESFWQQAWPIMQRVMETQMEAIRQAAQLFAESIEQDGLVRSYGTGHSRVFAMELVDRAGGLVPVTRMDMEDLAVRGKWALDVVKDPVIERNLEASQQLLSCYKIDPQDVFVIASQSGVNVATVEVAQRVKSWGHKLVVVTALEQSKRVPSRHPSGKKLYELGDIVIDNCGPFGDALLELPGGGKVCSVSSLTGSLIAQALTAETIKILLEHGKRPPVLISDNIPGGIENNQELRDKYAGRIHI
ncbi:MAG TPA: SIS domain-containing protein [Ktedonosporobacter sp.]|nr:SIS domain-containing protein [Ktedonosporobacter sp.]